MAPGSPLRTRDGAELTVRAIEPGDRDALQAAVHELSPESRHRRFLGPMKELQDRELMRLTDIGHRDHPALRAAAAAPSLTAARPHPALGGEASAST